MSVFSLIGGGSPFKRAFPPKWAPSADAMSYRQFAGPGGQVFTAYRWARSVAIATTALSVCLAGSTIYFAGQQAEVQTAVVVVDPHGRIEDVVAAAGFEPDERVKGYLVAQYIERARSISSDRIRQQSDLVAVDAMTTPQGAAIMAKAYADDAWGLPSQNPENRVRQVIGIGVFPPADGGSTFTAVWRERLWEGGRLVDDVNMRGSIVLKRLDGDNARSIDAIKRNPTGLWVDGFRWEAQR